MLRVSFEVTWKWFSFPFNIIQRLLTNPWLFPSQTVKTCRSVYLMTQVPFRYIRLSREVELRLVFMQFKSIPHLINIVLNVTIAIGQSVNVLNLPRLMVNKTIKQSQWPANELPCSAIFHCSAMQKRFHKCWKFFQLQLPTETRVCMSRWNNFRLCRRSKTYICLSQREDQLERQMNEEKWVESQIRTPATETNVSRFFLFFSLLPNN